MTMPDHVSITIQTDDMCARALSFTTNTDD
jgi:hypothetical protein